jgi:mannose-6-phosphate isomerase-like protein (cupin superfamily)
MPANDHLDFNDIASHPANAIFHIVFFPDRIYHAQYLNATRSPRYRYNVREVRSKADANVLKGEVFLDDRRLCNFLRIEYRASRLVEVVRERSRLVRDQLVAWVRLRPDDPQGEAEARVKLGYCPWIDAFQVELWETLEAPEGLRHDAKVLDLMGRNGAITRVPAFANALSDIKALRRLELAFRENTEHQPFGYSVPDGPGSTDAAWDNFYGRNIQVPNTQDPSNSQNTVKAENYEIDFQRGFYFANATDTAPVRYRNAMMNDNDPGRQQNNVIEMRWLLQQELGGSLVFFHEVTVPPGKVEGTHQHIGSEELYYIVSGEGFAYLGEHDDPKLSEFPLVTRQIFGLDPKLCRQVTVKAGSVIFTKSGGVHGIENPNPNAPPLKFVAFLYHST